MPTQITQIDDAERGITIFRVDGDMLREDADLLSRLSRDAQSENGNSVTIDLADLDFMDSESAPILMALGRDHGVDIIGTEIFLQTVVSEAERQ